MELLAKMLPTIYLLIFLLVVGIGMYLGLVFVRALKKYLEGNSKK